MNNATPLTLMQQIALIALRTLIGWHFLYEGYYKLMLPGWSSDGKPLAAWTSAGYLKAATGPLAPIFQAMANKGWIGWIDGAVKIGLLLIGLSLLLGLFTRLGCWGALLLLAMFYVLAIPTSGSPQLGNEGTYLFVNKTLIEGAAVLVLLAFNTGAIAGLDLLWRSRNTVGVRGVSAQ
ncbi:MAG: DoxX subfamily [Blastocatellia bacterium]|nr:DoxX subfamily [Blastocatellia bacterium]